MNWRQWWAELVCALKGCKPAFLIGTHGRCSARHRICCRCGHPVILRAYE